MTATSSAAHFTVNGTPFSGCTLSVANGRVAVDGVDAGPLLAVLRLHLLEGNLRIDACDVPVRITGGAHT